MARRRPDDDHGRTSPSPKALDGKYVDWLEKVTDEQYNMTAGVYGAKRIRQSSTLRFRQSVILDTPPRVVERYALFQWKYDGFTTFGRLMDAP